MVSRELIIQEYPGITGTPAFIMISLEALFDPISMMAWEGGPMNSISVILRIIKRITIAFKGIKEKEWGGVPSFSRRAANFGFSDKNP